MRHTLRRLVVAVLCMLLSSGLISVAWARASASATSSAKSADSPAATPSDGSVLPFPPVPSASIARTLDANNQPRLQLLGVSSGGWTLQDSAIAAICQAAVTVEVGMPLLSFDPTAAGTVDALNNTLHLSGLNAFNGQVFTYYSDPNYSSTVTVPALASGFAEGVVAGSNRWNAVQLPTALADGALVAATFLTGIPLPISPTAPADLTPTNTSPLPASLAGIANGTSLYLRQLKDTAGNPTGVELFSDAAGKQPILLGAAAASPDPAYFQVRDTLREAADELRQQVYLNRVSGWRR